MLATNAFVIIVTKVFCDFEMSREKVYLLATNAFVIIVTKLLETLR